MKRILFTLLTVAAVVAAKAQVKGDDVFLRISDDNMFSRCFIGCDTNGDNIVTYDEAAAVTVLTLDPGGRLNIIENYDFLKYFPNLTALHVGNTTVESIDLTHNPKLEYVSLENALWLRVVKVAGSNIPRLFCPHDAKVMTVIVGEGSQIPASLDDLNVEKHLNFSEPVIEQRR